MARPSKPWFRESKGTWYCTVEGRKVSLKVRGKEHEKEAIQAWHRLFAGLPLEEHESRQESLIVSQAVPMPEANGVSVGEVIQAFLEDVSTRAKANTVRVYRLFLTPFALKHSKIKACDLTPTLCEAYSRKAEWSDSTRNDFLCSLTTAFRWGVKARLIPQTPLAGMVRPPKRSKGADALLTADEYARLLIYAKPAFDLLLKVLWLTGCRPSEAAAITAENFDEANGMVRLSEHKTAHKGKSRVLYLPPEAVALLRKQRERYPQGPLLRNQSGRRWKSSAIVCAMRRTRERAGVPHAIAYGLRHSFATDALANGVPDAQVAELMGHSGTAMLYKHYSHLGARSQVLRDALGRVR